MIKGVAYLFRYKEVSRKANDRYLEALAVVEDSTTAIRRLDGITTRKETKSGRGVRAFNPLSRDDILLFEAMIAGSIVSVDLQMPIYAPASKALRIYGI